MAEYAQLRIQEMTPILEQLRNLRLIPYFKIRVISDKIQYHEYTIQKSTRSLDDVLKYVEFQLSVLENIREAREELQIFTNVSEIETPLQNRIKSLFGIYQRSFYDDMKFWQARINFTLGQKWYEQTSKTYQDLTNHLGKKHPFLWQRASDFEWKRNPLKGIDAARRILQLGIRGDNRNLDLYVWTFELELKHAEYLSELNKVDSKKKSSDMDYTDYSGEIQKCFNAAKVVFNEAKNNCWGKDCTVKLYVVFHSSLTKYPPTFDDNFHLLRELEANCSSEEETYHVLAMLAFNTGDLKTGLDKLNKGLEIVHTVKMYEMAVHDVFSWAEVKPSSTVFKQLHNILNKGHNNDKLSASCYIKWAELCGIWETFSNANSKRDKMKRKLSATASSPNENKSKENLFPANGAMDILNMGLNKYQNHPELILAKAKVMVYDEEWPVESILKLISLFDNTETSCYDDLCTQLFMSFMLDHHRRSSLENLVNRVNNQILKEKLSIMYLNNVALNNKMEDARKYYKKMDSYSYSYKFHRRMAELEFLNIDFDNKNADPHEHFRKIMERACLQFGQTIDPWIDFIKFENQLKNSNLASKLYERALKALPENLRESFICKEKTLTKPTNIVVQPMSNPKVMGLKK